MTWRTISCCLYSVTSDDMALCILSASFLSNRIYDAVDYTYFLFYHTFDTVKEMDPQLPAAFKDYSSSMGYEPLPFRGAWATTDLGRLVPQSYPMSNYGYLVDWPLPPCHHPAE